MKREFRYFLSVVIIFLMGTLLLLGLFKKYAVLAVDHLWNTCRAVASDLNVGVGHYLGFVVTGAVSIFFLGLFLKTLSSYIKTKKSLGLLLRRRIPFLPKKLSAILNRNNIRKDLVIVVDSAKDYALTIDWFFPRVVISSSIINRLSEKQLEAVILHEFYHLKNKHPLLIITSEILSSSLGLLPILRDITAEMRTVLEKEADRFVVRRQSTSKHLNLALERVRPQSRFGLYPAFSKRNDYKFNKVNLFVSSLVMLAGVLLFSFPINTDVTNMTKGVNLSSCGKYVCSTHCLPIDTYRNF